MIDLYKPHYEISRTTSEITLLGITTEYRANFLGKFVEPARWLASRLECLKTAWLGGSPVSSLYVYVALARRLASRFERQEIEWPGGSPVVLNVERSSGSAARQLSSLY